MSDYIGKHLAGGLPIRHGMQCLKAHCPLMHMPTSQVDLHACHLIPTAQGTSSSIRGRGAPILLGNRSMKSSATPGRQLWSWLAPSSAG